MMMTRMSDDIYLPDDGRQAEIKQTKDRKVFVAERGAAPVYVSS